MKKVRKVRMILMLGGLAAALLGMLFAKLHILSLTRLFLVLAFAGIIGHLIYTLMFWHCPHCQKFLPMKGNFWSKYCPHCGKKLDDEEG